MRCAVWLATLGILSTSSAKDCLRHQRRHHDIQSLSSMPQNPDEACAGTRDVQAVFVPPSVWPRSGDRFGHACSQEHCHDGLPFGWWRLVLDVSRIASDIMSLPKEALPVLPCASTGIPTRSKCRRCSEMCRERYCCSQECYFSKEYLSNGLHTTYQRVDNYFTRTKSVRRMLIWQLSVVGSWW